MGTVSKLATSKVLCTWEYNARTEKVCKITPHQMVAHWTGKQCATYFRDNGIENSANYCIGYDGDICCNVEEQNRAWTSSSGWNDQRAITVELSNSASNTDRMTDATIEAFKKLATDVALRYRIKKYTYTGDGAGSFTLHRFYGGTSCPGDWFVAQIPSIINDINARIANGSVEPVKIELPKAPFCIEFKNDMTVVKAPKYTGKYKCTLEKGRYRVTSTKNGYAWVKGHGYVLPDAGTKTYSLPFRATVLINDLNVRATASTNAKIKGTAPKETLTATKVVNHWAYIPLLKGWIYISEPTWVSIKE